jgi:methionyl-tRNA synthetase
LCGKIGTFSFAKSVSFPVPSPHQQENQEPSAQFERQTPIMNEPKRYLVTSALPYANGPLHIGHLAGAYLPADIYVRMQRLMGKDVVFICGSDEHGAAITIRAKKDGVTPKEIVDKYHKLFEDTFQKIGISFDIYHRTSSPLHHETSQDFFRTLYNKGEFTEQESEQYFDEEAKQFLADRYIIGTCPKCGNKEAYGDQCEKCGSTLSPTDLIEPKSTLTGATPVLRSTKHWYLPLNKHENWLRDWIENGQLDGEQHHDPADWKNHVIGQCKSWLDQGLQPRAMTRDLEWGVDVPQEITGSKGKKLYVWLDAPIGYISATKQWAQNTGKDWKPYWKDKETGLIHFIGKDNIVFHCLIFPVILKTHGDYNLPINVPANQFMNLEDRKISTSKNWAVWVHEYVDEFEGMEDELRYNMVKNMPELRDSEFTWKGFQETNNNELVNNLANFIQRVMVLTNKYYEGVVPDFDEDTPFTSSETDSETTFFDAEMVDLHDKLLEMVQCIHTYDFRGGLKALMDISSSGNQLLQFNQPWALQKTNPEQVQAIMHAAIQIVGAISVACRPFMPFTSDKLRTMLNLPAIQEEGELQDLLEKLSEGESIIPAGHQVGKAQHLFSRIPDDVIEAQIEKLKAAEAASQSDNTINYAPLKDTTTFDDFIKLDIRTGNITEAEKMPKADKLLKLSVDLGFETRTIVSGIAEHFKPEEVIGKSVVVLANLAPRKLRGVESEGMILMAEDTEGKLTFVSPSDSFGPGMVVR